MLFNQEIKFLSSKSILPEILAIISFFLLKITVVGTSLKAKTFTSFNLGQNICLSFNF